MYRQARPVKCNTYFAGVFNIVRGSKLVSAKKKGEVCPEVEKGHTEAPILLFATIAMSSSLSISWSALDF